MKLWKKFINSKQLAWIETEGNKQHFNRDEIVTFYVVSY